MGRNLEEVGVVIGVVDGGIGINWEYLRLDFGLFKEFLHEFLEAMGFGEPRLVSFEKNRAIPQGEKPLVDWFRPRISVTECQVQGVRPGDAVHKARRWLTSEAPAKYGIKFRVNSEPVATH